MKMHRAPVERQQTVRDDTINIGLTGVVNQDLGDFFPWNLDGHCTEIEVGISRVPLAGSDVHPVLRPETSHLEPGLTFGRVLVVRERPLGNENEVPLRMPREFPPDQEVNWNETIPALRVVLELPANYV